MSRGHANHQGAAWQNSWHGEVMMTAILGPFSSLFEAVDEEAWCSALFGLSRQMGFERTMFAVVPRSGMSLEDAFLRTTYAKPWRTLYEGQGMAYSDPTVSHCLSHTTPLLWSPGIFSSEQQKQMYEEACCFGLRTGLTLPMHGPRGEVGISCFVTDRPLTQAFVRDINRRLPSVALLRDVAFETCQPYLASHAKSKLPALTPKEKECLKWTAVGKSSWDIAQMLRCSEAVVNFHLSNVRRKLNVSSRRAAAVKAVRLGLIPLE